MDVLLKRVHEEVMSNPPLGYEPQEAATRFFDKAKFEVAASRQEVRQWAVFGLLWAASLHTSRVAFWQ